MNTEQMRDEDFAAIDVRQLNGLGLMIMDEARRARAEEARLREENEKLRDLAARRLRDALHVEAESRRLADAWFRGTWLELRNDQSIVALELRNQVLDFARAVGVLTSEQAELWRLRFRQCPGHGDEGGRAWCAYCGENPKCGTGIMACGAAEERR